MSIIKKGLLHFNAFLLLFFICLIAPFFEAQAISLKPKCLDCIGSKEQELIQFYREIGQSRVSCLNDPLSAETSRKVLTYPGIILLTPDASYNPFKMNDLPLIEKFQSLCPNAIFTPIVLGFTDYHSGELSQVSAVFCDGAIYPLRKEMVQNCQETTLQITTFLESPVRELERNSDELSKLSNSQIYLQYRLLTFSEFSEGEYLRCSDQSSAVCESLCFNKKICLLPTDSKNSSKAIISFIKQNYQACSNYYKLSPKSLLSYFLKSRQNSDKGENNQNYFAFSASSTSLHFDPEFDNENEYNTTSSSSRSDSDFTIIDNILDRFHGIFDPETPWARDENNEFLFSDAYRNEVNKRLLMLCGLDRNSPETPYVWGTNNNPELILCHTDGEIVAKVLISDKESCSQKLNQIERY